MTAIDYISYAFLLFFITFFIDIFIQYFRTKTIVPRKMFTYKKGGVFEHYIIVGVIMLLIVGSRLILDIDPFNPDESYVASLLTSIPILVVAFIFLVFLFVFVFYFITAFYVKITKVENRNEFYEKHTHRMIVTAFILSAVILGSVILIGFLA